MTLPKRKPCPKCGSPNVHLYGYGDVQPFWYVECDNGNCLYRSPGGTQRQAVAAHNAQAVPHPSPAGGQLMDKLKEARERLLADMNDAPSARFVVIHKEDVRALLAQSEGYARLRAALVVLTDAVGRYQAVGPLRGVRNDLNRGHEMGLAALSALTTQASNNDRKDGAPAERVQQAARELTEAVTAEDAGTRRHGRGEGG